MTLTRKCLHNFQLTCRNSIETSYSQIHVEFFLLLSAIRKLPVSYAKGHYSHVSTLVDDKRLNETSNNNTIQPQLSNKI